MAPERPAIPAELRRQILVEAGHRCAIHTCRHPDVDVHHIEPWSRVRDHRAENLIALCPNCHRRAELGEIDRRALRLYKVRLAAAFRFEELNVYPEEIVLPASLGWLDPSGHWTSAQLTRAGEGFEIALEYPQFGPAVLGAAAALVNQMVRNRMEATAQKFLRDVAEYPRELTALANTLDSSFAVSALNPTLVSIRAAFHAFAGGVHGSTWFEAWNFRVNSVREFDISEMFADLPGALAAISTYASAELLRPSSDEAQPRSSEEWVRSGTNPERENYKCLNLTGKGVLVTFSEYQVGPYVQGWSEVHMLYRLVQPYMSQQVKRAVLWRDV